MPNGRKKPTEPDVADTVIGAKRQRVVVPSGPDEDTLVSVSSEGPYPLVEPPEHEATFDTATLHQVVVTEWDPQPLPQGARYHSIRIVSHEPITLDAPALIGRHPSSPRIPGKQHPKLIRVPSPTREISSTHVEIRQEGSTVVVTDLVSTNGTLIAVPGHGTRKLRQGESAAVTPGTLVELGDGITIEILPTTVSENTALPNPEAAT